MKLRLYFWIALTLSATPVFAAGDGGPLEKVISLSMFILFLIVFVVAGLLLKKYAWEPILNALEEREGNIAQSLENAEKIANEMEKLDETCAARIAEADDQSKAIIVEARKGAGEAARVIEDKAREEAQILMENARRDIGTEQAKAQAELKSESTDLAVELASKILGDNLDEDKSRKLADQIIDQI